MKFYDTLNYFFLNYFILFKSLFFRHINCKSIDHIHEFLDSNPYMLSLLMPRNLAIADEALYTLINCFPHDTCFFLKYFWGENYVS